MIRDGTAEAVDYEGEEQLEHHALGPSADAASPAKSRSKRRWLLVTIVGVALLVAGVSGVTLGGLLTRKSPDEKYLAALRASGLAGQFASDANAIAHAKQTCRTLDDGGPQQGRSVDKVAVDRLLPAILQRLPRARDCHRLGHLHTHRQLTEHLLSVDHQLRVGCSGSDGYSDVNEGTQVVVKNGKGEILATTTLGHGTGSRYQCTFPVSFDITEGQDRYLISTGRRVK